MSSNDYIELLNHITSARVILQKHSVNYILRPKKFTLPTSTNIHRIPTLAQQKLSHFLYKNNNISHLDYKNSKYKCNHSPDTKYMFCIIADSSHGPMI